MKPKTFRVLLAVATTLSWVGCHPQSAPAAKKSAAVYRLFDLFQPEDLSGKVSPEDVGWPRVEWAAKEMAAWTPTAEISTNGPAALPSAAVSYRALTNITDTKIDQDRLTGTVTGPESVLDVAFRSNRGGGEPVKAVEIRMSVSGPGRVWLKPEASAAPDEKAILTWATTTHTWENSADVEQNKLQSYRFELKANEGKDLRHIFLSFRETNTASFAIASIRLISEREERLKEASGQQWAGLGEIYHASLAVKTPEVIKMPLRDLPEGAVLQLALGTREDSPVKFKVAVSGRDAGKDVAPAVLFERMVTIPNRWQPVRIDLAKYAGKSVLLQFTVTGDSKGLWGYWGSPTIRSASSSTAMPSEASGKRKPRGVILLVIDTLRKDHLNIYGYPRETLIYLKKFAEEGVAFSHAISQGTMTKISVPSIVTSLYPMSHTVLGFDKGLPASAKTIAEVFRDEGYATLGFSSVPFTGKANNMHQGYDELHEKASISDSEFESKTARHYVDRLIPWLEQHRDQPFFVFLHVFDPHSPFRPRPPYDTLWGAPGAKDRLAQLEEDMRREKVPTPMGLPSKKDYEKTGHDPEELLKIYKDWYDGSIRGVDAEIGRLLEAMRDLGIEKDTLMVWATDHGEEFWEHGRLFHGHSVYGELNQVPLVVHWPNGPDVRKGAMVDNLVQNIDIMPTILELAGIQGPTNMQGRSLVSLLNGSGSAKWDERPAFTQAMVAPPPPPPGTPPARGKDNPHFGVISHGWKLIRKELESKPEEELFEHPADALDLTNLVQRSDSAEHRKELGQTFQAWKTMAHAAELPSDDSMTQQLSSEELRRLRALGYVGGTPAAKNTTNAPARNETNAPPHDGGSTNGSSVPK